MNLKSQERWLEEQNHKNVHGYDQKKRSKKPTEHFPTYVTNHFTHLLIMIAILFSEPSSSLAALVNQKEAVQKLAEEYTDEEKIRYAQELLELGDQLFEQKNYEQALAAYEQVFLMDPENRRASAKIDILKKQMMKEGKDETGLVKEIYDEEAKERIRDYWIQARDYLKNQRYAQARFTLEKILLLDPLNQEAQDLYQKLKQKPAAGQGDEAGETL